MTLGHQVARGLKWQLINVLGRQVLSFVVFSLLARALEPSAFGVMSLASAYVAFIGLFATQGLGTALIQRRDVHDDHLHTAFWFNVAGAGVLCLGTLFAADWFANLMREPALAPVVKWLSLSLFINALSAVHSTLLVKELDFRKVTLRALSANLCGALTGVILATQGYGVWALAGQQLAIAAANTTLLWSISDFRPQFRFSFARLKELYAVGISVFFTTLLWFFSGRVEQFIIGRFMGATLLGHYTVAGRIPELANLVFQRPLSEVALPALSKLQTDPARMRDAIYRGAGLLASCCFPIFAGLALTSERLIPLLFGAKWQEAGWICSFISLLSLVGVFQVFLYPTMIACGESKAYLRFTVIGTIANIAAASLLLFFEIQVMLMALIVVRLAVTLPGLFTLKRLVGLDVIRFYRTAFIPLLGTLIMTAVVIATGRLPLLAEHDGLFVAGSTIIGAVTYLVFSYFFNQENWNEVSALLHKSLKRQVSRPT